MVDFIRPLLIFLGGLTNIKAGFKFEIHFGHFWFNLFFAFTLSFILDRPTNLWLLHIWSQVLQKSFSGFKWRCH